jgi:DNA-binding HxlR family transcriptional regulator
MKPPIFYQFEKINRKWVFRILFVIFENEKTGFNYIKKALSPITSRVLSSRLTVLEETALVAKSVISDKPKKVEYYLTEKGKEIMSAMAKNLGK